MRASGQGGGGANLYGSVTAIGSSGVSNLKGASGANYGGAGGGGGMFVNSQNEPGMCGDGALRIIWGENRAFPSTNVGDR